MLKIHLFVRNVGNKNGETIKYKKIQACLCSYYYEITKRNIFLTHVFYIVIFYIYSYMFIYNKSTKTYILDGVERSDCKFSI